MSTEDHSNTGLVLSYLNLAIIVMLFLAALASFCCWAFIPHVPIVR